MKAFGATLVVLLLSAGPAAAGSLDGDRYVAERYGRLEISAPAGRWEFFDREGGIASDEGGPVVDLQLRQPVAGLRPTLRITGVRKGDATVSADSILRTSREAFVEAGGELGPILVNSTGGRTQQSYEGRIAPGGQAARSRVVLLEGPQAFFLLQMVVPAAAFDEAARELEHLLPTIAY